MWEAIFHKEIAFHCYTFILSLNIIYFHKFQDSTSTWVIYTDHFPPTSFFQPPCPFHRQSHYSFLAYHSRDILCTCVILHKKCKRWQYTWYFWRAFHLDHKLFLGLFFFKSLHIPSWILDIHTPIYLTSLFWWTLRFFPNFWHLDSDPMNNYIHHFEYKFMNETL